MQPDPAKIAAVQEMPEPTNVSELKSFLGMVNQLGKFIPCLAEKDKPLRDLLFKKNCWIWEENKVKVLKTLKEDWYDPNKPLK